MTRQIAGEPEAGSRKPEAVAAEIRNGTLHVIAPDLAYQRLAVVNVAFLGAPDAGDRG